ncbi:hypothetical protein [Leifsonia xyli]|uniref:hypothetical protein n=1 Tax=Leifsonia xyli TaxID=1575 RepID=UPI003D666447
MSEQTDVGRDAGATRVTVLRPHRHLFLRGIIAVLALTTPVFAVVYWLTIPGPGWPFVLVAHLIVIGATVVGVASFLNTTITVGPDGVRERGFFGRTVHVAPGEAGSVILVQVYESSTLDVLPSCSSRRSAAGCSSGCAGSSGRRPTWSAWPRSSTCR